MSNIYGRQVVLPLVNKTGAGVVAGDVVIVDTANDGAFTTTTSGQSQKSVGVAQETIANNATGRVLVSGYAALINVPASVTRGHYIETHTVAKQATGNSTRRAGSFGQFLTGGTTPTAWLWGFPDNSGAAGETVATSTIWDAAGDLVVGTGADAAARLAIGAVGGHVSRINGAVAWDSGTSNPGSAVAGDRYWRSDLKMIIYYDGTRWLSEQLFHATFGTAINISATATGTRFRPAMSPALDLWLVAADISVGVFGTNNGSNYWTYTIDKRASNDGATTIFTADTSAVTASTWTHVVTAIGASCAYSTAFNFIIQASVKTGTPANLQLAGGFTYRLIVT